MTRWTLLLILGGLLLAVGCDTTGGDDDDVSDDDVSDDDDTGDDDTGDDDTGDDDTAAGCEAEDPPCIDDLILDLSLHDNKISEGGVQNTTDGDDIVSVVDATAGGFSMATENPFIYLRFEDDGLVKVDIDDETALESQEWHIAARRYIVRLNSGTSGPSCVAAAALFGTDYADVTEFPAGTTLDEDRSYDDDCEMIDDGSGLDGSPDVTLSPWWTYTSCVATTLVPFVVELEDGRHLKLLLEAYYGSGQEGCNNQGSPGGDSANLTWRWSWLD